MIVRRNSPFKFLNVMVDHVDLKSVVKEKWCRFQNSRPLLDVWFKLKSLKGDLKFMNSRTFQKTADKIDSIRIFHLVDSHC